MKSITSRIFLLLVLVGNAAFASPPVNNKIVNGFKQGSAEAVSRYFNETVELNAPNVEGLHSKDQANFILKDFFRNNPPKDFSIKHNGDSKNGSHYAIGELTTSKGVFRVYLLYLNDGEQMSITELRIESDD